MSVLHLLGGTLRLRYKGWVRLKSTRELKQLSVAGRLRELGVGKTLASRPEQVQETAVDEEYENLHVLGMGMDGGAKERPRAGETFRSGQQRVHRRIGGAVALRARVEAPPALARDRREDREEPADRDDREARRVPRAGLRLVGLRPERRR